MGVVVLFNFAQDSVCLRLSSCRAAFDLAPPTKKELITMNEKEQGLSESVWNVAELLERVDNDQELLRELLAIFKEDFPESFQSLKTAVTSGDLKSASRLSHTLKGMLSSLGATRAAAAASRLEALSSTEETAPLRDALNSLESEADRLLPELEAYMPEVRR
jgi:HPt (histidine-containing phosphotransfer) domain-containing protein